MARTLRVISQLLPLLWACGPRAEPPAAEGEGTSEDGSDDGGSDDGGSDGGTDDTATFLLPDNRPTEDPSDEVDLLVIGAGPAGLAAAWEAREAGASVIVLELGEVAGGGGRWADRFFAVGTPQQAEEGIEDSVERALSEWSEVTGGAAPDATTEAFLAEAAETLDWTESTLGLTFGKPTTDAGGGPLARIHVATAADPDAGLIAPLVTTLASDIRTRHRAEGLVSDGHRVVGATLTDLDSGELTWIAATTTLVATGGFARAPARVDAHRPDLHGAGAVFEMHQGALGLGLDMLEELGAAEQNAGAQGAYVHATADPRPGYEGEAIWLGGGVYRGVWVNAEAQRVADEHEGSGFALSALLAQQTDAWLLAIVPATAFEAEVHRVPPYLHTDGEPTSFKSSELVSMGVASKHNDAAALASAYDLDSDALTATLARYNELAALGEDLDFGKSPGKLTGFGTAPLYAVPLRAGLSKSFTGVAVDADGQVFLESGEVIPGLRAAGEVAGMLGSEASGIGFSGSITACYWLGRRVGRAAAREISK